MLRDLGSQKLIRTTDMMQQIANDINKMKRSLLRFYHCGHVVLNQSQVIAYKGRPEVGSPLRIRRRTTTSRVKSIKMELPRGSAREMSSLSGKRKDSSYGSMENVGF